MIAMFYEDSFFNQGLGSWSISDVTTMAYMLSHTGLSQTNYDSTLEAGRRRLLKRRSPWAQLICTTPPQRRRQGDTDEYCR